MDCGIGVEFRVGVYQAVKNGDELISECLSYDVVDLSWLMDDKCN
jgi:hypothetical protein